MARACTHSCRLGACGTHANTGFNYDLIEGRYCKLNGQPRVVLEHFRTIELDNNAKLKTDKQNLLPLHGSKHFLSDHLDILEK